MPSQMQALAAWLLSYALHSTILLGLAWTVLRFRQVGPGATEVIWKVALVGGIVTATAQGMLSHQPAGSFSFDSAAPMAVQVALPADAGATDLGAVSGDALPAPADTRSSDEAGSNVGDDALPDAAPSAASDRVPAISVTSVPTLIATCWLVVALLLIAGYVARRLVLIGRLGDRRPVSDRHVTDLLDALRTETGVSAPVRLTTSRSISSPVALAGEICLPAAVLDELEPEQQRAMLAHELAHLVRRDPQWLAAACLLERAFFFQPLNRLARRGVQSSAEYLADEWAARRAGGVPLARALVKVAEWIQASPLGLPVAGFAEERSQLTARVSRLLDRTAWATQRSRWGVGIMAAAILVVTTAFAPGVSRALVSIDPSETNAPEPIPGQRDAFTLPAEGTEDKASQTRANNGSPRIEGERSPAAVQPQDTSVVAAIIGRLRDENADVRRAAAEALGRLQHPSAIQPLIRSLEDEDPDVRDAALDAMDNFEDGIPAEPIRRLLDSPEADIRSRAAQMLGEMKDRGSIAALTALVTDANADVRQEALEALDDIDAPVDDAVLGRALGDPAEEVRETAAEMAGDRRMVTLVPALVRLLDDSTSDVRQTAAEALTEMRTEESHRALRMAITHPDAKVRLIAVEYLGQGDDR